MARSTAAGSEKSSPPRTVHPTAVGRGELTFRQEPNGAYTGSTWVYDVTVRPQPKIAPAPALAKRAENRGRRAASARSGA